MSNIKFKEIFGLFILLFLFVAATFFIDIFYFNTPAPNWFYSLLNKEPPTLIECENICPPESELYYSRNIEVCCRPGTIKEVNPKK